MKASVQYDDYVGTCAADINDFQNLEDILKEWNVDTGRFFPVGVTFFSGSSGHVFLSILCEDKQRNDGKIVKISYDRDPGYSAQEVVNLFKRFEVILTTEGLQDRELVDEPVVWVE